MNNGISNVGITEICGESGSGKSQMCLQLAVTVQLPEHLGGLGKGTCRKKNPNDEFRNVKYQNNKRF